MYDLLCNTSLINKNMLRANIHTLGISNRRVCYLQNITLYKVTMYDLLCNTSLIKNTLLRANIHTLDIINRRVCQLQNVT